MPIIKLNATNSTNTFLKELSLKQRLEDYTVVQSDYQTNGRGQMQTVWSSNAGENLTFSVFKEVSFVKTDAHFYISMVVALAVLKTLKALNLPKLSIKWPNDILSENQKICGVLIENSIKKNEFKNSIIGIGMNVNQKQFSNLPKASSMFLITGNTFNTDEILHQCLTNLKFYFGLLEANRFEKLKTEYELYLYKKNKPATFKTVNGLLFSGIIQSVSKNGMLQILVEDSVVKEFNLKEITLQY